MKQEDNNECFVVMPFGKKPYRDDSNRLYDFEKVYRVLIQRAVREAGMIPVRADERLGSGLIHTDMFKDLRDRSVVLADLSLDNPNVFYELGIRHVMSSRGTVLICKKGTMLPFDVKLSRTIFYDFDGQSLDWEEVEKVVCQLVLSLKEAQKGLPDSPVHALLESVLPPNQLPLERAIPLNTEDSPDGEPLSKYQKEMAKWWKSTNEDLGELLNAERSTVFGSRALGYYCLDNDPTSDMAKNIANRLNDGQQYRLANQIYLKLYDAGKITPNSQLAYASSYSEEHSNVDGAKKAIKLVKEVLKNAQKNYSTSLESPEAILLIAHSYRRLAGLQQWHWQLTHKESDLNEALDTVKQAVDYNNRARRLGVMPHAGFLAQAQLKLLLLLRAQDQSADRPDNEGLQDAILAITPDKEDDPVGISYLYWFQAITWADMGEDEESNKMAATALSHDGQIGNNPKYWDVGRRQYIRIRRFLEQYSQYLRNPNLIGRISQQLQAGAK